MNTGTSRLFSQLLSLVDRDDFRRLVRQTGSEARSKGFASRGHFVSMLLSEQKLRVKTFVGTSANAVRIQIMFTKSTENHSLHTSW